LEDSTVCPKNNGGVSVRSVSEYIKGITLNVVPLHSSTETASRVATSKMAYGRISQDMLRKFLVQHFLQDGVAGEVHFLSGLCKQLRLYGQNSRSESFGSRRADNKKYSAGCMARTWTAHMWGLTNYVQNHFRYTLKSNINFLTTFLICLNIGSRNPNSIFRRNNEGVGWIELAHNRILCWTLVNTALNLQAPCISCPDKRPLAFQERLYFMYR
jgi:hypothetical protein